MAKQESLRSKTKGAVDRAVRGRFGGVQFQETEDTGGVVGPDERKRAGARVERAARDLGVKVGGKFTAPDGATQGELNKWEAAAIADMRKRK